VTLSKLLILTEDGVVIGDDDVIDVKRCTEVDCQPRMHAVVGARSSVITTVNSQTCHLYPVRADLTGRLVQCEVVQDVDCTTCSPNPSKLRSHFQAGAPSYYNGPFREIWPATECRMNDLKTSLSSSTEAKLCSLL